MRSSINDVFVHMTEQWRRFWGLVVSMGEETTQKQIFRLMV